MPSRPNRVMRKAPLVPGFLEHQYLIISTHYVHAIRYRTSCQDNRTVYRACFALSMDAKVIKIESLSIEKRYVKVEQALKLLLIVTL